MITYRITILMFSVLAHLTSVIAHSGSDQGQYSSGMMSNGAWMHNTGHMTGYNMWGMGWWGLIPGLLIWSLIILGVIYLYQKITEENKE